jgi:plastocyanin
VGNSNNATLQGASRGTGQTRYGFEFTIPITLARYFGGRRAPPAPAATPAPAPAAAAGDTARVTIEGFGFRPNRLVVAPGTAVTFTNRDQVAHTVTGDAGGLESGEIPPGESRTLVFREPGEIRFHCTPHPFMTGVVEVRSP